MLEEWWTVFLLICHQVIPQGFTWFYFLEFAAVGAHNFSCMKQEHSDTTQNWSSLWQWTSNSMTQFRKFLIFLLSWMLKYEIFKLLIALQHQVAAPYLTLTWQNFFDEFIDGALCNSYDMRFITLRCSGTFCWKINEVNTKCKNYLWDTRCEHWFKTGLKACWGRGNATLEWVTTDEEFFWSKSSELQNDCKFKRHRRTFVLSFKEETQSTLEKTVQTVAFVTNFKGENRHLSKCPEQLNFFQTPFFKKATSTWQTLLNKLSNNSEVRKQFDWMKTKTRGEGGCLGPPTPRRCLQVTADKVTVTHQQYKWCNLWKLRLKT
jgi:hypothetical protein